ncbi:MAG: transglutaminase-like cysteine peptidase [Gammaproteobacteria bacterium]|nr:transglutaminase-like cysteine peptidase [Gammaproteobacteria bacterium]MBU2064396.1 transglutaminase-like cysteine peptidase [Gammaproteobacteria bacterium]MBU2138202.1 transglutaminase-like cysteine peptidase [Gammaproteobacteria bacterium]MBU2217909.1 transglutaminase-like cysteine peptidase [Gammaproteobacteria bacterium]MBU2322014.1 transglutaminase-like cysteine peptidase [Gammaproteobacteria bacterium]
MRHSARRASVTRCLQTALLSLALVGLGLASTLANWDFALIVQSAETRYGSLGTAKTRIQAWDALIQANLDKPEAVQLENVNLFFNRQLVFADDLAIWQENDYWATPVEALVKGAADCEDYSIAKYFTLRRLGIPSEKLRITYVKALRQNQAHMVLTYYAEPTAMPLVLDNLINPIRPANQRNDLLPVYSFNAEGLYLPGSNNKKGDTKKLSRWQDLLKKMRAEGFAIGEG